MSDATATYRAGRRTLRCTPWLMAVLCLSGWIMGQEATLILHGGQIWTGDAHRPEATAVATIRHRILAVGDDATILGLRGEGSRVIDLRGRRVIPGLIDSHVHFLDGGAEILAPDLRSADSAEEFARRLGEAAAALPAGTWITAGSWDHQNWPGAHLPTREILDRHTPDHPVFVPRLDGHMAVANSLAIRRAGVTSATPDPRGGQIERREDGEPAGVFKDAAMTLVARRIPPPSAEQRRQRARAAIDHALALGVTGVHDMLYGYADLATYQELREAGELRLRITVYTPISSHERWEQVSVRRGFGDRFLRLNGVKAFADGSLGSATALFLEPYTDDPEECGLAQTDLAPGGTLEKQLASSLANRLQPAVHAIGDRAIREVLDIFERSQDATATARCRIEHAQHIHPDDLARFRELGVIASMQPYHAIDDGRWAESKIGPERCDTTYAFHDLLDRGVVLAFGSDWPVAPLSPLWGIYAAVTRRTLDGAHLEGWYPRQKISVEEALRAYTSGGAFAGFREKDLGSITPGKLADLVVFDRDPLEIPPETIRDIRVDLTIVDGAVVYEHTPPEVASLRPPIVSCEAWGARPVATAPMRRHRIQRVTLHHSGVDYAGWPQIDGPSRMRGLQRFSLDDKKWPDVPYHYCVNPDGTIYAARDSRFAGDTNTTYDPAGHLLIELVGNFEHQTPTEAQLDAAACLCAWTLAHHHLSLDTLKGHLDYADTACPGKNLQQLLRSGALQAKIRALWTAAGYVP